MNGFTSPVAAAAYPPTKVVTTAAETAEPARPIRMSRRVGVYRQKSEMFATSVRDAPHITVT